MWTVSVGTTSISSSSSQALKTVSRILGGGVVETVAEGCVETVVEGGVETVVEGGVVYLQCSAICLSLPHLVQ